MGATASAFGVSFLEDREGWHGKALSTEQAAQALASWGILRATW